MLKNLKVSVKLLLIAVPLMLAIVVALVCASVSVQKTEEELTKVYFDSLYYINNKLLAFPIQQKNFRVFLGIWLIPSATSIDKI